LPQATPTIAPTSTLTPGQTADPIPFSAKETWTEPEIVWRPSEHPGQQLLLKVIKDSGKPEGPGNDTTRFFSYDGSSPGPTIRMLGDETLSVKLKNVLGQDFGTSYVREFPDKGVFGAPLQVDLQMAKDASDFLTKLDDKPRFFDDYCLGEHTNQMHSAHVTNLHTHGLHVRPGKNENGTQSDNILLRVMPVEDYEARMASTDPNCPKGLLFDEVVGESDHEFQLGDVQQLKREREGKPAQPHPPGTHWYHPHSHGSTHNQVASGMAGFLIIEGDVDHAINLSLTGGETPEPTEKTGDYDYRERLMFVQRVSVPPKDPDAKQIKKKANPPQAAINGDITANIITMRPGSVERWRVLNGSVDGQGFNRFMVLDGQYVYRKGQGLFKIEPNGVEKAVTPNDVEDAKQDLYQLAMDGVTLVDGEDYTIKELSKQNAGAPYPLAVDKQSNQGLLDNFEACYETAESIKNCYVRPNEVYLAPANRTDVIFQAPALSEGSEGKIYTIVARASVLHSDIYQSKLQGNISSKNINLLQRPEDIVIAYVVVSCGVKCITKPKFNVMSLVPQLPDAPEYLLPITSDELKIGEAEIAYKQSSDQFRTRTVVYSGWGANDYPLISVSPEYRVANPELASLTYGLSLVQPQNNKTPTPPYAYVLIPPESRSLAIDGRKFDDTDPTTPQMLVNTAEEWAVYNSSLMLWGDTDTKNTPQPGQYGRHYKLYPISRSKGQKLFKDNPKFQITTKGVDHPFHIHTNPTWVMRIEVPDKDGNLVNILPEPRWQDVIWLPRGGGRVVFRSRFADYTGQYVNHCHILLHEDNGMMQVVEVTDDLHKVNYKPNPNGELFASGRKLDAVNKLYPVPSLEEHYQSSIKFVDPNKITGQVYPGFSITTPTLPPPKN
jgi:FtsP/CotA-like multicopper oxidase with cupredoxin domain